MGNSKQAQPNKNPRIWVLRWGHRIHRDIRLTTHVALAARALGADGFILSDVQDPHIEETIRKITRRWGGKFHFEMGTPWRKAVDTWHKGSGVVVHLTAYGENIQTSGVLPRIKKQKRDVLLLVGSQKVPGEFYAEEVSDFNVAVGNQPHSECASLAVFLDRYFRGKELAQPFEDAKIEIVPKKRGKEIKTHVDLTAKL
jgi:tRNA (cytidine56-2'-O)-methyltransferase